MFKTSLSPFLGLLCVCASVILWGGCSDTTETVYADFSLSRYSVVFPVSGGTNTITVGTADNWNATTNAGWLTLNVDGSTLYITAGVNTETDSVRQAEVTVTTSSFGSATVIVSQEPKESPVLSLVYNKDDHAIDSEGGEFMVAVSSNYNWTAGLVQEISGWELYEDYNANLLTIVAGSNSGDTIIGTVTVTASDGCSSVTETFEVTQASRADNPYFQFVGDWDIYSEDCNFMGNWLGPGIYTSCTFAEYDYTSDLMSFFNFQGLENIRSDAFEYDKETCTLTVEAGGLCGSMTIDGTTYFMYLECISEAARFITYPVPIVVFTLSDDGNTISVSGIPEQYPILGYLGYNAADQTYYVLRDVMPYCKAPLTLSRGTEPISMSLGGSSHSVTFNPITEIPDGIPIRIPEDICEGVALNVF